MSLEDKLNMVHERILNAIKKSGRKDNEVKMIAVTKKVSVDRLEAALKLGLTTFGENYAQEAIQKVEALKHHQIDWHFLGHLQSNKVKLVANKFAIIHSVDSEKIMREINSKTRATPQRILIEVNLASETTKSGVSAENLDPLIECGFQLPMLTLAGLMFMPPLLKSENEQRHYFERARGLFESIKHRFGKPPSFCELSMGTSGDFESAIIEGATLVRIGTSIFGERK